MGSEETTPDLVPAKIDWPSGHVTVERMRAVDPNLCDDGWLFGNDANEVELLGIYRYELLAAQKAFAAAMGREEPEKMVPRGMILDCLEETYGKYGIASGRMQAKELLRRIEDAAIGQAVAQGGRDPRRGRSGGN